MGGVDLLDNMVSVYDISYRKKKWWFPIYTWSLNVSAVQAWRLMRHKTGKDIHYLDFIRELTCTMLESHGTPMIQGQRAIDLPPEVQNKVRYDGLNHWPVNTELDDKGKHKRRNCKKCAEDKKADAKTLFICEKCKVPLHIQCFKVFIET